MQKSPRTGQPPQEKAPDSPLVEKAHRMAVLLMQQGQTEEGVELLARSLLQHPVDPHGLELLTLGLRQLENAGGVRERLDAHGQGWTDVLAAMDGILLRHLASGRTARLGRRTAVGRGEPHGLVGPLRRPGP